jgi:hypothetical protein
MVGKDQINIAHDDDCLTGSSLKSFVKKQNRKEFVCSFLNILKLVDQFFLFRSQKFGSAALPSGSIGDHLTKLHQDLLQPANCPMNTFSILK